jgi:UDP-2,4-diacetamido-2,4,6-trideoxy-beta-L-altropyranose hydrolase
MKEPYRIIFRADGNRKMGLGHLVRSSALADMVKDKYDCILATRCDLEPLLKELSATFSEIICLPETDYLVEAKQFDKITSSKTLVVLDGYHFDDAYQKELFQQGFDIFSIDDIHAFPFYSKAVINHAGGLTPLYYDALPTTQFFLGPKYALLRAPFLEAAKQRRKEIAGNNCFVCFGGADPDNRTMQVLNDNNVRNKFRQLHVVMGNAFQYKEEVEAAAKSNSDVVIHHALSARAMVSIMQQCSFAICAPSTIAYEYLCVGGILFLEQIADNQKDVMSYFMAAEMAFPLNQLGRLTKESIKNAFDKQAACFDGSSGERFEKIFHQYFEGHKFLIRKVNEQDLERCFRWANGHEVRAQSYNEAPISLEEHTKWFTNKLRDPHSYFYILEFGGEAVAQIRFLIDGQEAVLGYLASGVIRSRGLGTTILAKGIEAFTAEYKEYLPIVGYVKKTNIASQRSFERLAFKKEETTNYPDSYKYTMNYGN